MEILELAITVIVGLVLLLVEDFSHNAVNSLISIFAPLTISLPLGILVFRRSQTLAAYFLICSIHMTLSAILLPALVYGGLVTHLRGIDAYGMLGLSIWTYVILAGSAIFPALLLKSMDPGKGFRYVPIVMSSLGVLYVYSLSSGWWSRLPSVKGFILVIAEILAPAIYAYIGILTARYWRKKYDGE
jgi:hypothetical protein